MSEIADVCIMDEGVQEALDLLDDYGILFAGMDDVSRFTQLFTDLNNHSRKWVLRGHTPSTVPPAIKRR